MPFGCVLLDLQSPTDNKNQVKMNKCTVLGTLPLCNVKDPDPYKIKIKDPDQKGLDPQHCLILWKTAKLTLTAG